MPRRPNKPCRHCKTPTRNRSGYCERCEGKHDTNWGLHQQKSGNRHQRGYGSQWDKLREDVISQNRKDYASKYFDAPEAFKVEEFPNLEGRPLQGFCVIAFANGIIRVGTHVDHITPKSRGGNNNLNNLQLISKSAHQSKTARERVNPTKGIGG